MFYFDTNLVVLTGNLGNNPNYALIAEKKDFATFNLAVNKHWEENGEARSQTDWFIVILNGHLARFAKDYLSKGNKVLIEGELRMNRWLDEKGVAHISVQVLAHKLKSLDKADLKENASNNAEFIPNNEVTQ